MSPSDFTARCAYRKVHVPRGADFMDSTPEAVRPVNRAHAPHCTTSIFLPPPTGSPAQLNTMLKARAAIQREWQLQVGARAMSVHFYGSLFAEEKLGAHGISSILFTRHHQDHHARACRLRDARTGSNDDYIL